MAAADAFFRCVYEGCISGYDTEIERRPYHRNCSCALHGKSRGSNHNHPPSGLPKCKKVVSYPIRRSYSEGSLVLASNSSSSSTLYSPPSFSPKIQLRSCTEEEVHNISISLKV